MAPIEYAKIKDTKILGLPVQVDYGMEGFQIESEYAAPVSVKESARELRKRLGFPPLSKEEEQKNLDNNIDDIRDGVR